MSDNAPRGATAGFTVRVNNKSVTIVPPAGDRTVPAKTILREADYYPYRRDLHEHRFAQGGSIAPNSPSDFTDCAGYKFDDEESVDVTGTPVFVALRSQSKDAEKED